MEEPDYTTLSLRDLYDIRSYIDRERFPERFERLEQEIARREAERRASREGVTSSFTAGSRTRLSKPWVPLVGCTVLAVAALAVAFAAAVLRLSSSFTTEEISRAVSSPAVIGAALSEAYPEEEISASVSLSTRDGRTVIVTLKNSKLSQLSQPERQDAARQIASAAFQSDPESQKLSGVRVIFRTHYVFFLAEVEDESDTFFFEPHELTGLLSAPAINQS